MIDLNVKSDIQHPVYLKQITVARWNPKTSWREAGDRSCGDLHPKADSESEVFHDNFVDLGKRHYKYANVSSHIKANFTAVELHILVGSLIDLFFYCRRNMLKLSLEFVLSYSSEYR